MLADDDVGDTLAALICSYLKDDELALLPEDPESELRRNTWHYSIPDGPVDVAAVVAALRLVQAGLRLRLAGQSGPGVFYAWYDGQAGQLRCSLTSASVGNLPFSSSYRATGDPAEVVTLAASDTHPGIVPCDELSESLEPNLDRDADGTDQPLPVWAVIVP